MSNPQIQPAIIEDSELRLLSGDEIDAVSGAGLIGDILGSVGSVLGGVGSVLTGIGNLVGGILGGILGSIGKPT